MSDDRSQRARLCVVTATPLTLKAFMLGHLRALSGIADITMVSNFAPEDDAYPWPAGMARIAVPIARPVAPWADLAALVTLIRLFRRQRYDLVYSVTPKAGLLAMLAARLTGMALRVHTFTGQVWVTRRGFMRGVLKGADCLIARLATHVLADSPSQRQFLLEQGVVTAEKSGVLAHGSICGVDTARFRPDAAARERVRRTHGIPLDALVFLYLGRINRDKGLVDLAQAFSELGSAHAEAHLLLVGPDEGNLLSALVSTARASAARLHWAGLTDRPEAYFAAADVFCLPSYREGFGTTIIEAAAAGLPSLGSRIYGITDAIIEGETGLLFEAGQARQIAQSMRTLADDAGLRLRMGERARKRALRDFSATVVTAALAEYCSDLLSRKAR